MTIVSGRFDGGEWKQTLEADGTLALWFLYEDDDGTWVRV